MAWKDAGMRDTEFYERLLGLKEPWKVKAVKMDVAGRGVEVEVECAERTIWASLEGRQRPYSWLGEKELATPGHLRICHGDYGGGGRARCGGIDEKSFLRGQSYLRC